MVVVPLPPVLELERLLEGLLMRTVKVGKTTGAPDAVGAVGHYRTDAPVLEIVVLVDLPLAAGLAGALSLVPTDKVVGAVESGGLDASLRENLGEVLNVLSRFVSGASRRFGLGAVCCAPEAPPDELVRAARASDEQRVVEVEVQGYGAGRLAFCTL